MRINLARLAIVLIVIAIGLTLFGGPFVIGTDGWPVIEYWSMQFWSLVAATISFPLFDIARRTKSDEEATKMFKGLLSFYRLILGMVFCVLAFLFLLSPGGFGLAILFLVLASLCALKFVQIV